MLFIYVTIPSSNYNACKALFLNTAYRFCLQRDWIIIRAEVYTHTQYKARKAVKQKMI